MIFDATSIRVIQLRVEERGPVSLPYIASACVEVLTLDPIFLSSAPTWNPLEWDFTAFGQVVGELVNGGPSQIYFVRTLVYVAIAVTICLLVGYPVAYYIARHGGRMKVLGGHLWRRYVMGVSVPGLDEPDGLEPPEEGVAVTT